MKNIKPLLIALSVSFVLPLSLRAAQVASDAQLQAISEMGRLNGIALQCRFLPQVQRIKRELVLSLPKQRALGDWFEKNTSESFMAFMQNDSVCPAVFDFDQQLQQAVEKLETTFNPDNS